MVFYGIIYAILENDMRRILAYSIVNQVGFMVTGDRHRHRTGAQRRRSPCLRPHHLQGAAADVGGFGLFDDREAEMHRLGGLFRTMPLTTICGIVGALSISAFPLTSGFVAKSMIAEGAAEEHMTIVWFLLAAASAGVFLHAGIKFPWFVFFQKDFGIAAAGSAIGDALRDAHSRRFFASRSASFPAPLYAMLPYPVDFVPYTGSHVVSQLQLLLFSGLAFFVCSAGSSAPKP